MRPERSFLQKGLVAVFLLAKPLFINRFSSADMKTCYGYRQYRFAGQHSFYNNLELRIKLTDFASYILPGQFGITGFFDIGRVWEKNDNSGKWHKGVGGGFYFAPAQLVVLQMSSRLFQRRLVSLFYDGFPVLIKHS